MLSATTNEWYKWSGLKFIKLWKMSFKLWGNLNWKYLKMNFVFFSAQGMCGRTCLLYTKFQTFSVLYGRATSSLPLNLIQFYIVVTTRISFLECQPCVSFTLLWSLLFLPKTYWFKRFSRPKLINHFFFAIGPLTTFPTHP